MTGSEALGVMNATRNDSNEWFWIIIILFAFWGNGFNRGDVAQSGYIASEFTQRDIAGVNTNLFNGFEGTNQRICDTRYDLGTQISDVKYSNALTSASTDKEILENRYANALGFANAQKDTLLGDANINANIAQTNYAMQSCCCEIKNLVRDEVQSVKDLINGNTIQSLRDQLNLAEMASANAVQTQNLLATMGTWRSNPSYPYCGCNCGN